jgi:threonine aldolase
VTEELPERSDDELAKQCTRFVGWHGRRRPADSLAELLAAFPDLEADRYGNGGVVAELESEVTELLGKPAAVFMPSGTMAQQIAMRIHADARHRAAIAFHPTSHLELHELSAYQRLHGLIGYSLGDARRLVTLADLEGVREPLAAVLWELPQREIGGRLPEWDDLVAQVEWARGHGAAIHLDGARLWECTPHYQRTPAEISALFDTVYVSFYKGLGGLAGCCLAGEQDVIDQAREWRARHGGTLFALWPYAASALAGLRRRLPMMPAYVEHAARIAAELRPLPDVEVVPDPPPTPLMHLHLRGSAASLRAAARSIAENEGILTWLSSAPTDSPQWQRVELTVGDATLAFEPKEIRRLVEQLVAPAA